MVNPLLNASLHFNFLKPVNLISGSPGIRRTVHQLIELFLSIVILLLNIVHAHPFKEFRVIDHIFLECIACLIHIVHADVGIVRVHLCGDVCIPA